MLRWGKVSVKCYVVIDHILATPTRPYGIAFKYSYSICTVILLIKSSALVLDKGRKNTYVQLIIFICDQICQKGSYTCTVSGLTFHYHSTDTTIDQQFMLVPLPNLQRSAFTEASFTGLSGVHGCSGGLLMASAFPARQTDGRESPQDWLVRLGIDLATF